MIPRRTFVQTASAATALSLTGKPAESQSIPLDIYDPFGPLDDTLETVFRFVLLDSKGPENAVRRLWTAFTKTGERKYGEWALQYGFVWWRDTPLGSARIKVCRIIQKMADSLLVNDPDNIAATAWHAAFEGFEALSRGILDSLHVVPSIIEKSNRIIEQQPDYYYGIGYMAIGRVYFKAPPFPVSRGNLKKSIRHLEKARPYAEHKFSQWYFYLAEALHLNGQIEESASLLNSWEQEIQATNKVEILNVALTRIDVANFRRVLASGKYDRYLWDAWLEPITRDQMREQFAHIQANYLR